MKEAKEELFEKFPCNSISAKDFGIYTDTLEEKILAYEYFMWRGIPFGDCRMYADYIDLCKQNNHPSTVGYEKIQQVPNELGRSRNCRFQTILSYERFVDRSFWNISC